MVGVSCMGGYRGKVARKDCEKALKASGQHRDFIVRESETTPGSHSITVKVSQARRGLIHAVSMLLFAPF